MVPGYQVVHRTLHFDVAMFGVIPDLIGADVGSSFADSKQLSLGPPGVADQNADDLPVVDPSLLGDGFRSWRCVLQMGVSPPGGLIDFPSDTGRIS
jgi:hypothetical protein